jgi:hypothetical protein
MPAGAVKVTFRVKEPESDCVGAVLRKNEPRLLAPLREPLPSEVVPEKLLPLKVSCGTPVTVPVVEPETVTSSARATPWARVKRAMAKMLSASGFTIERIRLVMVSAFLRCSFRDLVRLHSLFFPNSGAGAGQCSLLGLLRGGYRTWPPLA